MRAIRHMVRGCGYLEHCGDHPGTPLVIALIVMGVIAGSDGGWKGSLGGAALMGASIGPLYLWGAYKRSVFNEKLSRPREEG